jgi:hypothetical protein
MKNNRAGAAKTFMPTSKTGRIFSFSFSGDFL